MSEIRNSLDLLLTKAQKTVAAHASCLSSMERIASGDPHTFAVTLLKMIRPILLVFKREPAVERLIQFLVKFIVATDIVVKQRPLINIFLSKFSQLAALREKAIRMRSCQLIAGILNNMRDDVEISMDVVTMLEDCLLDRARDKVWQVRVEAIPALSRLQQPDLPNDPINAELIRLMSSDPSRGSEVRKTALARVIITKSNLSDIVERTRDVDVEVRKQAFEILAFKFESKVLTIKMRCFVMNAGLRDRDPEVKKMALVLARSWLRGKKENLVECVGCFDPASQPEVAELVAQELLNVAEFNGAALQLTEADMLGHLPPEKALVWRVYAQHLKTQENMSKLEDILPDIPLLIKLLSTHSDEASVSNDLLRLAQLVDKCDEAGRAMLSEFLRNFLVSTTDDEVQIPLILNILQDLHPDEDDYNRLVLEAISEVIEPVEMTSTKESLKLLEDQAEYFVDLCDRIEALESSLTAAKRRESPERYRQLQDELEEWTMERDMIQDRETERVTSLARLWMRCLTITETHLKHTPLSLRDPGIALLKDKIIIMALKWHHHTEIIRQKAFCCLGVYCMLELEAARSHLKLFRHALENDTEGVQEVVMQVLFDHVNLFGSALLQEDDSEEPLMTSLYNFFMSEDIILRRKCAEGFTKLLYSNQCRDRKIMGTLILTFFNPETLIEDALLQQIMSIFLPAFAFRHGDNQQLVADVFPRLLQAVFNAHPSAPLGKVNPTKFLQYLLELTDYRKIHEFLRDAPAHLRNTTVYAHLHNEVGCIIVREILTRPDDKFARILIRHLPTLAVYPRHSQSYRALRSATQELLEVARAALAHSQALEAGGSDDKLVELIREFAVKLSQAAGAEARAEEEIPATPQAPSRRLLAPRRQALRRDEDEDESVLDSVADPDDAPAPTHTHDAERDEREAAERSVAVHYSEVEEESHAEEERVRARTRRASLAALAEEDEEAAAKENVPAHPTALLSPAANTPRRKRRPSMAVKEALAEGGSDDETSTVSKRSTNESLPDSLPDSQPYSQGDALAETLPEDGTETATQPDSPRGSRKRPSDVDEERASKKFRAQRQAAVLKEHQNGREGAPSSAM